MSSDPSSSPFAFFRHRWWRRLMVVAFLAGALIAWFVSPSTLSAAGDPVGPHATTTSAASSHAHVP